MNTNNGSSNLPNDPRYAPSDSDPSRAAQRAGRDQLSQSGTYHPTDAIAPPYSSLSLPPTSPSIPPYDARNLIKRVIDTIATNPTAEPESLPSGLDQSIIIQPRPVASMTEADIPRDKDGSYFVGVRPAEVLILEQVPVPEAVMFEAYKGRVQSTDVFLKRYDVESLFHPNEVFSILGSIWYLQNMNHPNILRYYGAYTFQSNLWVIREYSRGEPLADLIKRNKDAAKGGAPRVISQALATYIIIQVIDGLQYLNSNSIGVFNYNIVETNVIIEVGNVVRICDFALLNLRDSVNRKGMSSKKMNVQSLPPECVKYGHFLGEPSDVTMIGRLLWKLLSVQNVRGNKLGKKEEQELGPTFSSLIARMIDQDFKARPSLRTVRDELQRIYPTLPQSA